MFSMFCCKKIESIRLQQVIIDPDTNLPYFLVDITYTNKSTINRPLSEDQLIQKGYLKYLSQTDQAVVNDITGEGTAPICKT